MRRTSWRRAFQPANDRGIALGFAHSRMGDKVGKGEMGMRKLVLIIAAVAGMTLFGATAAHAGQTVEWTGNGLDSVTICVRGVDTPQLHWVLTPGGEPVAGTTAELFINGKDVGTMTSVGSQGALQLTVAVLPSSPSRCWRRRSSLPRSRPAR